MSSEEKMHVWENVSTVISKRFKTQTDRIKVPGGWLYRIADFWDNSSMVTTTTFVPHPEPKSSFSQSFLSQKIGE